jgi:hypothetical protein
MSEISILYLIGNGFDISVGLKTRYKDILSKYLEDDMYSAQFEFFKRNLNEHFDAWCDFEEQLGKFTGEFDIENIEIFLNAVRDFRKYMVKYLKHEEQRIDYSLLDEAKLKAIKSFIVNPYIYFTQKSQQTLKHYFSPSNSNIPKYTAISFNYTNIFDKCIEILCSKTGVINYGSSFVNRLSLKNILHIHGTLEEYVIMGVDNKKQIENSSFIENNKLIRTIIKPEIIKSLESLNDTTAGRFINTSKVICIFGMSIGTTDTTWWIKIGEWLKRDKSNHLLIFYKLDNEDSIHPEDIIGNIEKVKEMYILRAGNIKDIDGQIHISFKTDIFNLQLVKN